MGLPFDLKKLDNTAKMGLRLIDEFMSAKLMEKLLEDGLMELVKNSEGVSQYAITEKGTEEFEKFMLTTIPCDTTLAN